MKIYNLGSLNIDYVYSVEHFVSAGETLSSTERKVYPGGKGLNQSVALARAGAQVIHGALVGRDGEFLADTLLASGVHTERMELTPLPCGHAIIQVEPTGQNCILIYAGANHALSRDYIEKFLCDAQPGDILLLQNETNALDSAFATARSKDMQIAFNPSPFHPELKKLPLSDVDWWFCNEIEGEALFGSADAQVIADRFSERYPESHLILTLGENGSLYRRGARQIRQSAYKTHTADTTAAGDTFTVYFLAGIAAGQEIAQALDMASKAASIAVSRNGASESIPKLNEVTARFFPGKDG